MSKQMLIVINDLNTYKKGRTYFSHISERIEKKGVKFLKCKYKYFDTGDLFEGQKIGDPYTGKSCLFNIPEKVKMNYHARTDGQKTIQLIMEVI